MAAEIPGILSAWRRSSSCRSSRVIRSPAANGFPRSCADAEDPSARPASNDSASETVTLRRVRRGSTLTTPPCPAPRAAFGREARRRTRRYSSSLFDHLTSPPAGAETSWLHRARSSRGDYYTRKRLRNTKGLATWSLTPRIIWLRGPATTCRRTGHSFSGSRSLSRPCFSRDHVLVKALAMFRLPKSLGSRHDGPAGRITSTTCS